MCDQCDYLAADLSTLNNHINSLHEGKPSFYKTEKYFQIFKHVSFGEVIQWEKKILKYHNHI